MFTLKCEFVFDLASCLCWIHVFVFMQHLCSVQIYISVGLVVKLDFVFVLGSCWRWTYIEIPICVSVKFTLVFDSTWSWDCVWLMFVSSWWSNSTSHSYEHSRSIHSFFVPFSSKILSHASFLVVLLHCTLLCSCSCHRVITLVNFVTKT